MKKILVLLPFVLILATACAHKPQVQAKESYDPATQARIRVYFGPATRFHYDTACEPDKGLNPFSKPGTLVAKPRLMNLANTVIGMPLPADAARYYDEYLVQANQPMTITSDSGGAISLPGMTILNASPILHTAITFIPHAATDYEVIRLTDDKKLEIKVRQLRAVDGVVSTSPIDVIPAPKCKA